MGGLHLTFIPIAAARPVPGPRSLTFAATCPAGRLRRLSRRRVSSMRASSDAGGEGEDRTGDESKPESLGFKFDPDSELDAFGRDPKKETEFWRDHAREVLDSEVVRQAVEKHEDEGGDGLTDEQRAFLEYAEQLKREGEQGSDE